MMRFGALALALLALTLPACGGDDDSGSAGVTSSDSPPTTVEETRTTAEEPETTAEADGEERAPDGDEDSGDQGSDPQPPSRAEYIRGADRICSRAQAAIARPSTEYRELFEAFARGKIEREEYFRRGGELVERSGEIAQRAVADLKELPLPTSRRQAIKAYLRGAAEQAALLTRQGRALREGRLKEVGKLDRRVGQANGRTRSAAQRVDFGACGGGS